MVLGVFRTCVRWVLDFALPPRCAGCGTIVTEVHSFCPDCWKQVEFLGDGGCQTCGIPLAATEADTCGVCLAKPPRIARTRAAVAYGDLSRGLAIKLKYGRKVAVAKTIARYMQSLVQQDGDRVIIPVPLHRSRLWSRGFNQSALMASELSRRLAESQLRLLQLQIEPHFLFNTLGSAQQLAEKSAPDAARLIADLIRFLRAATPALRENATTLKQEAAMVGAYLAIMQTRLPRALAFRIDVPAELADCAIPPGMLITLVENAIKHGIEPCPGGGAIDVTARLQDGPAHLPPALVVTVADTGAGLGSHAPGQGIGLANIRERLALLHGDRAALELEENTPRGFVARLVFPAAHAPSNPSLPLAREFP